RRRGRDRRHCPDASRRASDRAVRRPRCPPAQWVPAAATPLRAPCSAPARPPPSDHRTLPALAAIFLRPLPLPALFLRAGGCFIALPCAIAAILLGTVGMRNADRRQAGQRGLARMAASSGWWARSSP